MRKFLLIASMLLLSIVMYGQQYIVSFKVDSKKEVDNMPTYVSVDYVKGNYVRAYIYGKDNLAKFEKLGYSYKFLKHPSMGKVINMATTVSEMANWDRYPTYEVYIQMMQDFVTNYPNLCRLDTIGYTQQGRLMVALEITDNIGVSENEPEFFYTSTMHGDETTGYVLLLRLADYLLSNYATDSVVAGLVNNIDIYINPLSNLDGTYHGGNSTVSGAQRALANGVDPNRNFPDPRDGQHPDGNEWQDETVAMMNFANRHHFVMSTNFHGGAEVYNFPWDTWTSSSKTNPDNLFFKHLGENYVTSARTNNSNYMTSVTSSGVTEGGDWYIITGGRQDYMNYYMHCKEVTIELSTTKLLGSDQLNTFWGYNKQSLLDFMAEVQYGISGIVKDANGNPLKAKVEIAGHDKDNTWVESDSIKGDYYRVIAPGTYDVTYSKFGYVPKTYTVTVSDWKTKAVQNVVLEQAQSITFSGNITDALTGDSIANAQVELIGPDTFSTETDSLGNFSFNNVPEYTYNLKITKTGYAHYEQNIVVSTSNNNVNITLQPVNAISFEDGNVPDGFTFSGNAQWTVVSDAGFDGNHSIKSGNISDDQSTSVQFDYDYSTASTISFAYKTSTEGGYDKLRFYIDGIEKGNWDGTTPWTEVTFDVTLGNHTFKWTYQKDGSQSSGSDEVWVDFITIPRAVPLPGTAQLSASSMLFEYSMSNVKLIDSISITNIGDSLLSYTTELKSGTWATITSNATDLSPSQSQAISITVDTTGLEAGTYHDTLVVSANQTFNVPITFIYTPYYNVKFIVKNDDSSPIQGANIAINQNNLLTNAEGIANISLVSGNYTYVVTKENYTSITDSVIVQNADIVVNAKINPVGISTINEVDVKIYPNPSNGVVNLKLDGVYNISIMNAIGKVISTKTINVSGSFDLSNQSAGIYFVNIKSINGITTKRIIIK